MQFICVTCGNQFTKNGKNGPNPKYCGRQCWPTSKISHAKRVPDEKNCSTCDRKFSRSARGGSRAQFCSDQCLRKHDLKQRKARRHACNPPRIANCQECGVSIQFGKWCRSHQIKRTRVCEHCVKSFIGGRKTKFCSEKCRWAKQINASAKFTKLKWKQCICNKWICKPGRKYCSSECSNEIKLMRQGCRNRACKRCKGSLGRVSRKTYCERCRKLLHQENKRKHRRSVGKNHRQRARQYGVCYEPVNRNKVFERDGWKCGICNRKVDKRLKHPNPRSASLDHIIPLSWRIWEHGHTYVNTRCAHFDCNVKRSNRIEQGEQLAMVG